MLNLTYGLTLTVRCNNGFVVNDPLSCISSYTVGCGDDGNLTGTLQTCVPAQCPPIADPLAMPPPPNNVSFGRNVTVVCSSGNRASRSPEGYSSCRTDRVSYNATCRFCGYLANEMRCMPNFCGSYSYPGNTTGVVSISNLGAQLVYGQNVTVACAVGYRGADSSLDASQCSSDSIFNATCEPSCNFTSLACRRVTCPSPGFPNLAPVSYYGDQIVVSCPAGYRVGPVSTLAQCSGITSYNATCSENCTLNSSNIECVRVQCSAAAVVPASSRPLVSSVVPATNETFAFGDVINVTCSPGYRISPNGADVPSTNPRSAISTCSSNCGMTPSAIRCGPMYCDATPIYALANIVTPPDRALPLKRLSYFSNVTITCAQGYMLATATYVTCNKTYTVTCADDGTLVGIMECVPVQCGNYVSEVKFGSVAVNREAASYGQLVTVSMPLALST